MRLAAAIPAMRATSRGLPLGFFRRRTARHYAWRHVHKGVGDGGAGGHGLGGDVDHGDFAAVWSSGRVWRMCPRDCSGRFRLNDESLRRNCRRQYLQRAQSIRVRRSGVRTETFSPRECRSGQQEPPGSNWRWVRVEISPEPCQREGTSLRAVGSCHSRRAGRK